MKSYATVWVETVDVAECDSSRGTISLRNSFPAQNPGSLTIQLPSDLEDRVRVCDAFIADLVTIRQYALRQLTDAGRDPRDMYRPLNTHLTND